MHRPSVPWLVPAVVATLALGACRNGNNNATDSTGMNSAAGQVPPADSTSAAMPAPGDTGAAAVPSTGPASAGAGTAGAAAPGSAAPIDTTGAPATTGTDTTVQKEKTKRSARHKKG